MSERPTRAKRSLGQNFLVDENIQRKIVAALGAGAGDEVLEIGPGRGALTRHLVGRVRRLDLVELDDALAASLAERYDSRTDVRVTHADVLEVALADLTDDVGALKVVGNIPYNITTPILFHMLARPRPRSIVLMVQSDVADRIVAQPGTREYGALSIGVRTVAGVERLFRVGRRAFRPVPRVDSAVVRFDPVVPEPLSAAEEEGLRGLVRAAFQWRRKQMGRILRDHGELGFPPDAAARAAETVGFSLEDRPERLTPDQFVALSRALPRIGPVSNL